MTRHDDTKQLFRVPDAEIHRRIGSLQQQLRKEGIDGALVIQRMDLFYFSGTAQTGYLYVPAEGEPLLLIKKHFPRAEQESAIVHKEEIRSIKELTNRIALAYGGLPKRLGLELDVLPVREVHFYRNLFQPEAYADIAPLILQIRQIKSPWDIACMEKTADLSRKVFAHAGSFIKPGLTGYDLSAELEIFSRKLGHSPGFRIRDPMERDYASAPPVKGYRIDGGAFHYVSTAGPYRGSDQPIKPGEPILINIGTVLNGWHLDETRMFAMGSLPKPVKNTAWMAAKIHGELPDRFRPGMAVGDLKAAMKRLEEEIGTHEPPEGFTNLTLTVTGNGLGVEWREPPDMDGDPDQPLLPGMTFSLNVCVFKAKALMAGVKNIYGITDRGMRRISRFPDEVTIC